MEKDGAATGRERPSVPLEGDFEEQRRFPLAYFLTWTTYGSWLHGDDPGWTDRETNEFATPRAEPEPRRERYEREFRLAQRPMLLAPAYQAMIDTAIREACDFRGWDVAALNVRSNHLHLVVAAQEAPERIMSILKGRATRALREVGMISDARSVWTRHGSTRYLWREADVARACEYALRGQGDVVPGLKVPYESPFPARRSRTRPAEGSGVEESARTLPSGRGSDRPGS